MGKLKYILILASIFTLSLGQEKTDPSTLPSCVINDSKASAKTQENTATKTYSNNNCKCYCSFKCGNRIATKEDTPFYNEKYDKCFCRQRDLDSYEKNCLSGKIKPSLEGYPDLPYCCSNNDTHNAPVEIATEMPTVTNEENSYNDCKCYDAELCGDRAVNNYDTTFYDPVAGKCFCRQSDKNNYDACLLVEPYYLLPKSSSRKSPDLPYCCGK